MCTFHFSSRVPATDVFIGKLFPMTLLSVRQSVLLVGRSVDLPVGRSAGRSVIMLRDIE